MHTSSGSVRLFQPDDDRKCWLGRVVLAGSRATFQQHSAIAEEGGSLKLGFGIAALPMSRVWWTSPGTGCFRPATLPCHAEEGPAQTREREERAGAQCLITVCKRRDGTTIGASFGILLEPRKTKNLFAGVRQLADRKGQQERFRDDKATLPNSPSTRHTLLCQCPCFGCFIDLCGTTDLRFWIGLVWSSARGLKSAAYA